MIRKLIVLSAIVAAVALASVWASPRDSHATTWAPTFGPGAFYSLSTTAASANPDTSSVYNVHAPSANFSALSGRAITFGDADITNASAADIPGVGAYMGTLDAVSILGIANEGCNTVAPVTFGFVDANVVLSPPGSALAMTPAVTLTGAITDVATTFTYTSAGDPIGPSDDNPASTGKTEIEVDSEQMLVNTITEGTNTYSSVTRGWNGTTPAAHAASAPVKKVNVIFPAGPDTNLLANLAQDDGDLDNNGTVEFPALGGNQVADGADTIPYFIRDNYDPDGDPDNGGYVQSHARYYGVAFVAATLIVTLQLVIMPPGALTPFQSLDWATAAYGYSSATVLQDPNGAPSKAISDFCNYTASTTLHGIPHDNSCTGAAPPGTCLEVGSGFTLNKAVDGGCPGTAGTNECGNQDGGPPEVVRATNPASAQRVRFSQYGVSQRDYDDDDHANGLDTCHSAANPGWDPRNFNFLSGGDGDGDGLPTACDPDDTTFNDDQDGDTWQNRLDNCPLTDNDDPAGGGGGGGTVPNTFQIDQDIDPGAGGVSTDVPDGGPSSDSIGPACDIAGMSCGGCSILTPTGANGHYHANFSVQTICIGAPNAECDSVADADGDGVVNARDTCMGTVSALGANPPTTFPGPSGADTITAQVDTDTITVGSTAGFSVGSAIVIGSPLETLRYIVGPLGATTIDFTPAIAPASHGAGDPVAQVSFVQSMRDMNADGFSDISDVSSLTGVFGSQGGNPGNDGVGDGGVPGYEGRKDVNYDSFVDISDVSQLTGVFGATCGPP